MHPQHLLALFLKREGEEFRRRFSEATSRLDKQMSDALESVANLEKVISSKIEDIGSTLGWAEYKAGDAADTIETVQGLVTGLVREGRDRTDRLRSIIKKIEAEDPIKRREENKLRDALVSELKKSPELLNAAVSGKELSASIEGIAHDELNADDLRRIFTEAVKLATADGKSDPPANP